MIEEKHRLVELISRYLEAQGLTVVIGSENFDVDLHPFSVVASTFHTGNEPGTVGVIGPTRMRYAESHFGRGWGLPGHDPGTGRTLIVDVDAKTSASDPIDAADALRQERDELQDRLLRTAAEFDNYRKRTERERRELSDAVSADLMRDIVPVVDDLDRALAAGRRFARSGAAVRRRTHPAPVARRAAPARRRAVRVGRPGFRSRLARSTRQRTGQRPPRWRSRRRNPPRLSPRLAAAPPRPREGGQSVSQRDYYEILGVPRDASGFGLKSAYRKLALQAPSRPQSGRVRRRRKIQGGG